MVGLAKDRYAARHILVVDDDPEWRTLIGDYLSELGYRVSLAEDGTALRGVLPRETIDLILLDLRLPGEDGFALTTYVRQVSTAGIIIVTGSGQDVDEIVGLELGADDYIAKPCDLRHLAARVRAVLRRTGASTQPDAQDDSGKTIEFEGWSLNFDRRLLKSPAGADVHLTTAEFDLLALFATRPNRVLSRDQLMEQLRGRHWDVYDRAIDNQISRLRRKLGDDPKEPRLIKSVRGIGYVFTAETAGA